MMFLSKVSLLLLAVATTYAASEINAPNNVPEGASIEHNPSFSSISIEPAFWVEFAGTAAEPNELFLKLIMQLTDRGSQPVIRPGGIAMDSMFYDPAGGDVVRTMGPNGEIYRTTVGPNYFKSWSNFPPGVSFISTLNFGSNQLDVARDLAVASVKYQADRVKYFELGNEPNHYPQSRWNLKTANYVTQWKSWTAAIDKATNRSSQQWWASSATTDVTALKIRPADLIPAGIDSKDQVGQYSLHSYVWNTCNPSGAAAATIGNLLNHTKIISFANVQVVPSAKAALKSGKQWVMGEFNSVACSGKPGVTDTFTNALWIIDTELTYAALNASSVNLHQGGTLVLQSSAQTNTPGFSAYSFVYPRDSAKWGQARANPGYSGLLFLAEVFNKPKTQVLPLSPPEGVNPDYFSGYAVYTEGTLSKLILLNMNPYYSDSTDDLDIQVEIPTGPYGRREMRVKRLTAPSVSEKESNNVLWAGQSFKDGEATGDLEVERVPRNRTITIRGSEAVLVFYNKQDVFGI